MNIMGIKEPILLIDDIYSRVAFCDVVEIMLSCLLILRKSTRFCCCIPYVLVLVGNVYKVVNRLFSQARNEKAFDFVYDASLADVNITKVLRKQTLIPFPIGQIKSQMVNAHSIKRLFDLSGIDLNKTLNAKLVKELFSLAADAA